jgi:hypothetical protein
MSLTIHADRRLQMAQSIGGADAPNAAWDQAALAYFGRGNTLTFFGRTIDQTDLTKILAGRSDVERRKRTKDAFIGLAEVDYQALTFLIDDIMQAAPEARDRDFGINDGAALHQAGLMLQDRDTISDPIFASMSGIYGRGNACLVQVAVSPALSTREAALAPEPSLIRAAVALRPRTFWEKLRDVLLECVSFSAWNTETFNDKLNPEEWQDHAAALLLIGGPTLRDNLFGPGVSSAGAQNELKKLVQATNPKLAPDRAEQAADELYANLRALYRTEALRTDALCVLRAAAIESGGQGFCRAPAPGCGHGSPSRTTGRTISRRSRRPPRRRRSWRTSPFAAAPTTRISRTRRRCGWRASSSPRPTTGRSMIPTACSTSSTGAARSRRSTPRGSWRSQTICACASPNAWRGRPRTAATTTPSRSSAKAARSNRRCAR